MNIFLDVAISMAFVFLLFSIVVSGACEMWQMLTHRRAQFLRSALHDVFNDRLNKNYTHLLYAHPLVDRLKSNPTVYPAYIPSSVFADALIDVIRSERTLPKYGFNHEKKEFVVTAAENSTDRMNPVDGSVLLGSGVVDDFADGVNRMKESDLKQLLRTWLMGVQTYEQLRSTIIRWYDDYMGATSTDYKRMLTRMLFISGFVVAAGFNINAISLAQDFYSDKLLREQVVSSAIVYASDENNRPQPLHTENFQATPDSVRMDSAIQQHIHVMKKAYDQLGLLDLPIGWSLKKVVGKKYDEYKLRPRMNKIIPYGWELFKYILWQLIGWLITAAALSYGADYWFSILTRFVNIRTAVKPKEESK